VARPLTEDPLEPLIMGVDIARQGSDQTVIRFRREQIVTRGRWRTPLQQQGWSTPDAEPTIHKPIAAKRAAAAIRTLFRGTSLVTASPRSTAGIFASINPIVVPRMTIPMLWTLGALFTRV
jgi:hypothetical protein